MTYYKIIQNNKVTDVGCVFLKWNEKRHRLHICDVDEGQFLQSFKEDNVYQAEWLKPAPPDADKYPMVEAVVINEIEYEDLKELLSEGEPVEIQVQQEAPEEYHVSQEEETGRPMTIAEMRDTIARQQEQIDMLLQRL